MKLLEKIFSIKNENVHKVIYILGIKIKIYSLKLEIIQINKRLDKSDYIHNKRFEQWLMSYRWLEHTNRIINKLIENSDEVELKKSQIKYAFKNVHGNDYVLNLDNPKSFNEKIQWLSLNYYAENDIIHKIVDKYKFKEYIEERLGKGYTIPILGKWDNPEDIDYSNLPEQFVLKSNWGGMVIR